MITLQDIFNKGWQKFIVEKEMPAIDGVSCTYRKYETIDGHVFERRCIIGWALSDEQLDCLEKNNEMYKSINDIYDIHRDWFDDTVDVRNLINMQSQLHDKICKLLFHQSPVIKEIYVSFARDFNLSIPEENVKV